MKELVDWIAMAMRGPIGKHANNYLSLLFRKFLFWCCHGTSNESRTYPFFLGLKCYRVGFHAWHMVLVSHYIEVNDLLAKGTPSSPFWQFGVGIEESLQNCKVSLRHLPRKSERVAYIGRRWLKTSMRLWNSKALLIENASKD